MNPDTPTVAELETLTTPERTTMELRWYNGEMLRYAGWILDFAELNHVELLAATGGSREPGALLAATKALIVERGSVNFRAEIKDQLREIEKELWYRGEKGDHDRLRIQQDWTAAHAAAWRRWRIREYLFTAHHCAHRIIAVLHAADDATRAEVSPPAPTHLAAG